MVALYSKTIKTGLAIYLLSSFAFICILSMASGIGVKELTKEYAKLGYGPIKRWMLHFHLRADNGSTFDLKYAMLDNSVSISFIHLIAHHLEFVNKVTSSSWSVYPKGDKAINETYNQLSENINFLRGKLDFFKPDLPPLKDLTTKHLNIIHAAFEESVSKTFEVPTGDHNKALAGKGAISRKYHEQTIKKIERSLNSVNGLVHSMEHLVTRPLDSGSSWFSTFLSSKIPEEKRRVRIKEKDFSLFNLGCKWGDLLLGYGTTGKTLWHIYKDKDLALLESGGKPSPQQFITTNIFAAFFEMDHKSELDATLKWLKENKIGEKLGINIEDPHNTFGYVKIGEFVKPKGWEKFSQDKIIELISPYRNIEGYGLEIGFPEP